MERRRLEQRMVENVKKNNGGRLPDERQQQLNSTALAGGLLFGLLLDCSMMIYYFVTRNIEKSYPYLLQLIVIAAGFCLISFTSKDVTPPRTLLRRELNPDKGWSSFFRRLFWYAVDALTYSVLITIFDAYIEGAVTGTILTDWESMFFVFLAFDLLWCELRLRRYRRQMAKLDESENDLSD